MGEILVGRWRCPSCGKENTGDDYSCKSCGTARPEDIEFYLTEDSEVVTDEEKASEALSGTDWICEYCGSSNKSASNRCSNCGNSYDGEEHNQKVEDLSIDQAYMQNRNRASNQNAEASNKKPKGKRSFLKIGIFAVVIIVLLGILGQQLTKPDIVKVKITKHYWERSIDIQKYTDVAHSNWDVPAGAKVTSSHMEIYTYDRILVGTRTKYRTERYQSGTRTVKSGYKNLGNGKFQAQYRTEPIYSTRQVPYKENVYKSVPRFKRKYYYTIKEWVKIDHKEAHGYSMTPKNPEYVGAGDNLRNANPTQDYKIIMKDKKNKEYKKDLSYKAWLKYKDGQNIKLKVSKVNDNIEIVKDKKK